MGKRKRRKLKLGLGGLLMLSAMAISDKGEVILLYLFAAILHELGHLLAAKKMKIPISHMEFGFSGVRICVNEGLTSYGDELLMAIWGPLASLIAAYGAFLLSRILGVSRKVLFESAAAFLNDGFMICDPIAGGFGFFILASLLQAFSNLLPVSGFDGGRVLFCTFAMLFDEKKAERISSLLSALSAFFLWTAALYLMLKVSSGVAIYIFAACIFASAVQRAGKENKGTAIF